MTPDGGKGVRADDLVLLSQLRRDLVLTVVNKIMVIVILVNIFLVNMTVVNMMMAIMKMVIISDRTVFPSNDCYKRMR